MFSTENKPDVLKGKLQDYYSMMEACENHAKARQKALQHNCLVSSKMKDEQEHSTLVMATGAAPSQPHISSQSHLVDRDSLTQSLSVPEEPLDSSSTKQCCCRESATGATGFSSCAVVMHHLRSSGLISVLTLHAANGTLRPPGPVEEREKGVLRSRQHSGLGPMSTFTLGTMDPE
ncbi:hypothetical protein EYF80_014206 [Liparis tanakae]|uniref:Uncharacterized protein n=1 Tax=Liparis tanakae TaxID=230148 RepID=A0A4Z2ICC2_9TELE|nr:hypothetical protein EYF80_014206 [Liparis tanakae]